MKRYSFLILAILISGGMYLAPDYLFGVNAAEAATVRAIGNLGAGNSCGGMIQFGRSSASGIKLCKQFINLEYTPGTTQATVIDDVKTFSLRITVAEYNALSPLEKTLYTPTVDPGNGDSIYVIQLPNYRPYDSFCSKLGSGWSPYFTPERETANLEGCKHGTAISYTPGQTNQTAITDVYMGFFSDAQYAGGAVCGGGASGWSGWGWHGGVSVGFCKKAEALQLGTPTESPPMYACSVPPTATYTITPPSSTYPITYTLRAGTYTTDYTPIGGTPVPQNVFTVPVGGLPPTTANLSAGTYSGSGPCSWSFTIANPSSPSSSCVVPSNSGETFQSPYTVNATLPAGNYWGNNDPGGDWGPVSFNGNVTQTVGPGWYRGSLNNDSSQCSWNFRVSDVPGAGTTGPSGGRTSTQTSCSNGAANPPACTISRDNSCLNGALNPPACTFTHFILSPWVCAGYDPSTGLGGTETRTIVSSYTNTEGPSDSPPELSRACNLDPDFNFLSSPPGESGGVTLSSTYNTFATFVGGQQSALSVPVRIAISPRFASRPPNLTFRVVDVSTALPSGVPGNFTSVPDTSFEPNPLLPSQYLDGTTFIINVPRVAAGLYTLTVEASGGGLVKQAIVRLYVSVINPTFIEI